MKYAVFVQSSYHVPGDERSRTHPGHGYPEHNVQYTEVIKFKDEEELKDWIARNSKSYSPKKFEAVAYETLNVKTRIEVELGAKN